MCCTEPKKKDKGITKNSKSSAVAEMGDRLAHRSIVYVHVGFGPTIPALRRELMKTNLFGLKPTTLCGLSDYVLSL